MRSTAPGQLLRRPVRQWDADPPGVRRHRCTVFTCEVTLACCGNPEVGFDEIETRLRALDRRFSRFRSDSEVSQLNARAGDWCDISPEMYGLLVHALNAAVESEGLVNIAVLPALLAAGYVTSWPRPADGQRRSGGAPLAALTSVLELRRGRARLQPGHAVDLGGLAKGVWADDAISWLGPNSAVSIGGDVSCRGPGPDGDGWPVALPGGDVLAIRDGAVATSGTAKRRWGEGLHHLIDPRTGQPSTSDVEMATVVASAGWTAEWASTALVVGGTAVADRVAGRSDVLHVRLTTAEES